MHENRGRPVRLPELLAPAGSVDALLAAVAAGADAVYIGLGALNARAAARPVALDDFARACSCAHAHGVRVYVTENVYMRESELEDACALAQRAMAAGADALIVADAGFARLVRRRLPEVELHLSTQAGVVSAAGARLAAREFGVERATCARELSVDEIAALCATGVDIEVFCHGAICICYSGACTFSALRRGRSANRGDCTQPCRLSYDLVDAQGGSRVQVTGDRLLCPRDYVSVAHLAELVRAGVAALKIEGRMKNPDYVYNVVRTYRAALDALAAGAPMEGEAATALLEQLGRSFNRGFTDAYLQGASGAELMSFERAINQGVRVGTVVERGHHEVVIELEGAVGAGDTLEIRTILPADAAADVPARWPLVPCEVDAAAGERIRVRCKRRVAPGSPVYLTASARVRADANGAVAAMRAELEADPSVCDRSVPGAMRTTGEAPAHVSAAAKPGPGLRDCPPAVSVIVCTPAEARAYRDDPRVHRVYVRASTLVELPDVSWPLSGMTVILDEVCRACDEARVRAWCRAASAVVCRNLGALQIALEEGATFEVAAPVSATNSETVRWLRDLGARRVWLPDELSCDELRAVIEAAPTRSCGALAYGAAQLMVCEHCLLTAEGACDGDHAACARRRAQRFLVEADGTRLPVRVDAHGRTRIFNASPLDRRDMLGALVGTGIGSLLVDGELLDEDELACVLDELSCERDRIWRACRA